MVGLDLTDPRSGRAGIDALADDLDEAEALAADIGLALIRHLPVRLQNAVSNN